MRTQRPQYTQLVTPASSLLPLGSHSNPNLPHHSLHRPTLVVTCHTAHPPHTHTGGSLGDLIYPTFGYSAVVEGAVRYLLQPQTIAQRVSTLTYGFRTFTDWSPDMPDTERYRQWDEHYNKYVTDMGFLAAVRKGEAINVRSRHRPAACVS